MSPENGENPRKDGDGHSGEPSRITYKDISQMSRIERTFGWLYKPNQIGVGQREFDSAKRKEKLNRKRK